MQFNMITLLRFIVFCFKISPKIKTKYVSTTQTMFSTIFFENMNREKLVRKHKRKIYFSIKSIKELSTKPIAIKKVAIIVEIVKHFIKLTFFILNNSNNNENNAGTKYTIEMLNSEISFMKKEKI